MSWRGLRRRRASWVCWTAHEITVPNFLMEREQGDKVESSCCQRSLLSPLSLVLHFLTFSRMFWDSGSLHPKRCVGGTYGAALRDGLMVSERRFPGASTPGASFATPSANHPLSVPPTGPELLDGLLCGTVYEMAGPVHSVGFNFLCIVLARRCGVIVASCCGSGSPSGLDVVASMADCCGSSNS